MFSSLRKFPFKSALKVCKLSPVSQTSLTINLTNSPKYFAHYQIRNFCQIPPTNNSLNVGENVSKSDDDKKLDSTQEFVKNQSLGTGSTQEFVTKQALGAISRSIRMIYTCGVCGSREQKEFSRQAYTEGVVIVQCDQCEKRHLVADNLKWFGDDGKNIEDILREKGESVRKGLAIQDKSSSS